MICVSIQQFLVPTFCFVLCGINEELIVHSLFPHQWWQNISNKPSFHPAFIKARSPIHILIQP